MTTKEISDEQSYYLGMDDYHIILKESGHILQLKYIDEPRFGDSYHSLTVDGILLEGFFWGCLFIFIDNQQYMVCSWMAELYDRKTLIVDLETKGTFLIKGYWYDYKMEGDLLILGNDNFATSTAMQLEKIRKLKFRPVNASL
jgi:hypothetical protein